MKIAIYGREQKKQNTECVNTAISLLLQGGAKLLFHQHFVKNFENNLQGLKPFSTFKNRHDLPKDTTVLISFGGDGTLLESITCIQDSNIPIIGINTGRLGFLATIPCSEVKAAIKNLLAGQIEYESRTLLKMQTNNSPFEHPFSLNEIAITKRDTSSMITIHAFLDGHYLNTYWGDGVIVATPTGSTGYSLSCGGPIVMPQSNNLVITPICPHNLNVRPLVVPDSSRISFKVEARSRKVLLSLDSRSKAIYTNAQVTVTKQNFKVRLATGGQGGFIQALRDKLNWGLDKRN